MRSICSVLVQWDYHELKKKLFLCLTLVFDSCKTKQIDLLRDNCIMTLDLPEPNIPSHSTNDTLTFSSIIYLAYDKYAKNLSLNK